MENGMETGVIHTGFATRGGRSGKASIRIGKDLLH